ncbi:isochorismate pyruvate lyase [Sagittula marina]|uniref:chorismate mutase n=1 Tax=Sagittula marina TaxID=943940 RepID=A0A7W6DQ64_9RHOB|nr:chorismate mutase [Sagittula marina]MBB3984912.1 isochorismate pyruvate lyase [Sagittula marina]
MPRRDPDQIDTMAELRRGIDEIDAALMDLLAERWRHTEQAPRLKAVEGIAARATGRVQAVLDHVREGAEARGVDGEMVSAMWRIMIETVIAREERAIGKEGIDG